MKVLVTTHDRADLKAPYFARIFEGVRGGLAGWDMEVNGSMEGAHDGVILIAPEGTDPRLDRARARGCPVVIVNGSVPGLPSVDLDNVAAADGAMTHLISLGRRRIGVINGKLDTANGRDRREGAHRALQKAGLPIDPALETEGRFAREGGRRAMGLLLALDGPPEAVFAANDAMALGAWDLLTERGLAVPKELALMGFDDIPGAAMVGLTSVSQPLGEMGRQAAQWI